MKTSVEKLVFFYAKLFLGAEHSELFITSCPAIRSIHAQKRGILASIGAILEIFVFQKINFLIKKF